MSRPSRDERRQPARRAATGADNHTSRPDTSTTAATSSRPGYPSLSSSSSSNSPQAFLMASSSSSTEASTSASHFPSSSLATAAHGTAPSAQGSSHPDKEKKSHRSKSHVPPAVPRPPNAWILYRSARLRAVNEGPDAAFDAAAKASSSSGSSQPTLSDAKYRQGDLSKRLSEAWKAESPQVRAHFYALASQRQEEHKLAYPDYKYTPRVTDKLAKSRELRAAAAAAVREQKAKQEAEEKAAKQDGENDEAAATVTSTSDDIKPKRRASRKRVSTASLKRRTSSPTKPDAAVAAVELDATMTATSGFEGRPTGRTMRRITLTSPRSPRAGPYPPTSPHRSTRTSFEDASPALVSLASEQKSSFKRPSYGRRSISVAAADWPPSLFLDATSNDITAARASAPLTSSVDALSSGLTASASTMPSWGEAQTMRARGDASAWQHEAQQSQSDATEALPMLIHPDLLSISGNSLDDSGQTSDANMVAANESLELNPHLRSPLELGTRATEELGMFGGVGAPMYESADGGLVNFMLPDSLDHQAAMLLLMSDEPDGRGSGGVHSSNSNNNAQETSRDTARGSDGRLFALEVDGSLRPAGFMHFDAWAPNSQQDNGGEGSFRHADASADWSGTNANAPGQAFENSLETVAMDQLPGRTDGSLWSGWGKPVNAMQGSQAEVGDEVTSQSMLQTRSESGHHAQHAAHQPSDSTNYFWGTHQYKSPAVQQMVLHHSDNPASSSQLQTSPSATSGLTVSPQDLSSARNFTLSTSVSPAQVLRSMRYEMPWGTVVADAQRVFRCSHTVGAESSLDIYGGLPSAETAASRSGPAASVQTSRSEYVHHEMPATGLALSSGQVVPPASCSQHSQAPPVQEATASPLPRSPTTSTKDPEWRLQRTTQPAEAAAPALELSGLFTEADLLAHLQVLRKQRQQGPA